MQNRLKVLIVGSGAREHAFAWKVRQSPLCGELFCAPGNPGTAEIANNVAIDSHDVPALLAFVKEKEIDFTIVGPEVPLSMGIVDRFQEQGLKIFGPSQAAARLESSKAFAKEVMEAARVHTAKFEVLYGGNEIRALACKEGAAPIVLKADGLCAGKGVHVCKSAEQLIQAIEVLAPRPEDGIQGDLSSAKQVDNQLVVVAEKLHVGVEVSYIVATDGTRILPMASSHDYKRIGDRNTGPNTGGMGSISPTPYLSQEGEQYILERVIRPVLEEMKHRGTPFVGFLYAGMMLPEGEEPVVIEFNARCGDPETQSILRRLEGDLLLALYALTTGEELPQVTWSDGSAACVVLAAHGYPASSRQGDQITGLNFASEIPGVEVFHAGTARDEKGALVTAGGRVLSVTAVGDNLEHAVRTAYRAVDILQFPGVQVRRDIGLSNS